MAPKTNPKTTSTTADQNLDDLVASTKGKPKDLAPGLRPRPQPDVRFTLAMAEFGGLPPPAPGPPPPPPPPLQPPVKILAKTPQNKIPITPKKPIGKLDSPAPADVMDELKARIAQRNSPCPGNTFQEPRRIPPRSRSPIVNEKIAAELKGGIARLKSPPCEAAEDIRREQIAQKERDECLKATRNPPKITKKLGQSSKITDVAAAPPVLKTLAPAAGTKPGPRKLVVSKNDNTNSAVATQQEKQDTCGNGKVDTEDFDPYVYWSIKILGLSLMFIGVLNLELYIRGLSNLIESMVVETD
ncbi:hypothetical protein H072_2481 [Dactylellina haptotyla CBS 200.50]|uniref:Uncharacterized protein n=1 Tax=Dactylellina haptotyla (strain CBS 200.50) TaxID=1284197 RepID=S8AKV6_DACHA|nr:hypothetical protein H072_2481 [Dactylellina haptotyla CBS 200.50]